MVLGDAAPFERQHRRSRVRRVGAGGEPFLPRRRLRSRSTTSTSAAASASSLLLASWAAWYVLRQRRRSEEELRRSREHYRRLLEASPGAVALYDDVCSVTEWNATAERLYGFTQSRGPRAAGSPRSRRTGRTSCGTSCDEVAGRRVRSSTSRRGAATARRHELRGSAEPAAFPGSAPVRIAFSR